MKRMILVPFTVIFLLIFSIGCPTNPPPSSNKSITAFSFSSPAATGIITEESHSIAITVPYLTDLTALVPTITYTGVSIRPQSGVAQNFSSPVTFTVMAEDTSTQDYLVTVTVNQPIFADEFDTLNSDIWLAVPSLTPFPGSEGSNIPGEVKITDGILQLSRYAWELQGANPVSSIQTKNTVLLPNAYSVSSRFRNELIALCFGSIWVCLTNSQVYIGHDAIGGSASTPDLVQSYQTDNSKFYLFSMEVTDHSITVKLRKDEIGSLEETFSVNADLSALSGNSTIYISGGSNTSSIQYSEVDYIRIVN